MSDEQNLKPEETQAIQSAIEKLVDEETAVLPHLKPLSAADARPDQHPDIPASSDPASDRREPDSLKAGSPKAARAAKQAGKKPALSRVPLLSAEDKSLVSDWFFTFMCMNIPIVGWIYLFRLARGRGRADRREFARAYLFYKLLFLLIGLIILIVVGLIAMNLLDQLLAYMQML